MSALLMGRVWELDELARSERDVLLALADHAHDNGTSAGPGVPYLIWKLGLAKDTIHTALRGLERKRLIIPTVKGGGRGNVTEYQLVLENGTKKRPFRESVKGLIRPVNGLISEPETVGNSLARLDDASSLSLKPLPPTAPELVCAAWAACAPPLIAHRDEVYKERATTSAIERAVKTYPVEAVVKAIQNHAAVLASSAHYWSHRWTLVEFLKRGLARFVDEAQPLENFRHRVGSPDRVDPGAILQRAAEARRLELESE